MNNIGTLLGLFCRMVADANETAYDVIKSIDIVIVQNNLMLTGRRRNNFLLGFGSWKIKSHWPVKNVPPPNGRVLGIQSYTSRFDWLWLQWLEYLV